MVHLKRVHSAKLSKCGRCGKMVGHLQSHLNSHARYDRDKLIEVTCSICGKLIKKSSFEVHHRYVHQKDTYAKSLHCRECPMTFKRRDDLKM